MRLTLLFAIIASARGDLLIPLAFESSPSGQEFRARGASFSLRLAPEGLEVHRQESGNFKMTLGGRARRVQPIPESELPGSVNYLFGSDPARWRTGVRAFGRIRYRSVYPGIDLVYYGNRSGLEYDFVVAPGADPRWIGLRFGGASLRLTGGGDLIATTPGGAFTIRPPVAYQEAAGGRTRVVAGFVLTSRHTVSFRIGQYDRNRPLVIDPVLVYSTFFGGTGSDGANAVATDRAGNIYIAGVTRSPDFPVTANAYQRGVRAPSTPSSAFVTKLDPTGTRLIYSTYLGGSGGESALGIAVDASGSAYVAGQTASNDFPVTPGAFQTNFPGGRTSFVARLNPQGDGLIYSTYLGSAASVSFLCCDAANAVAVDASGNAYVAGLTFASGFPVTPGAFQTKPGTSLASNAFVAKLNPSGSSLVYATFLGGKGQGQFNIGPAVFAGDAATAIAVDRSGNAYVTGYAHSADFPVTAGAFQTSNRAATTEGVVSPIPGYNAFVSKLDPSGSALVYSTYLGGSGVLIPNGPAPARVFGDQANAIALDGAGGVYVAGFAYSPDFPVTAGAYQTALRASQQVQPPASLSSIGYNAFVSKLNPDGTSLLASTFLGGSGADRANALALDPAGNIYIAGSTTSLDFPVIASDLQPVNRAAFTNNVPAAFVAELNPSASSLAYSTFLSGSGTETAPGQFPAGDSANGLASDGPRVVVAGATRSADFPITPGALQPTNAGSPSSGQNAFVAQFSTDVSTADKTPAIRPNLGVVESASFRPMLSPGGLATIFGYRLAASESAGAFETSLGGTTVTVGGIAAPLLYVSPWQINFQVPWELSGKPQTTLVVTNASGTAQLTIGLSDVSPAIFASNASGAGQGAITNSQGQLADAAHPAQRGGYISIYCSGLGAVANPPATGTPPTDASSTTLRPPAVLINGVPAAVTFAGLAPGYVGLYQVNAIVPDSVAPGAAVRVNLTLDAAVSRTVTMAVQ